MGPILEGDPGVPRWYDAQPSGQATSGASRKLVTTSGTSALRLSPKKCVVQRDRSGRRLEATGHVTREPHPEDRRATLVTLTDHGTEVMTQMQKAQDEFARLLFTDLSDRQLVGLSRGLAHVVDRLRELVPKGERQ
jgi:hypothetical protein